MPYQLNSRDVLVYLNELGYTNINGQLLKEFMHDLKKLIKYEQKRRKDANENVSVRDTITDIFTSLYEHSTVESRAKQVTKIVASKDKAISVKVERKPKEYHVHCMLHEPMKKPVKQTDNLTGASPNKPKSPLMCRDAQTRLKEMRKPPAVSTEDRATKVEDMRIPPPPVSPKNTARKRDSARKKPSSQLIRPLSARSSKSDPVVLYHRYQEEWKKITIPGQDSRADLRWAIREKMMCAPKGRWV